MKKFLKVSAFGTGVPLASLIGFTLYNYEDARQNPSALYNSMRRMKNLAISGS